MSEIGTENRQTRLDYPTLLDVIVYRGKEYQVAGRIEIEPGNFKTDEYSLINPHKKKFLFKVKGAKFNRFKVGEEPKSQIFYRQDEGVRITGKLTGGTIERIKIPKK